MTVREGQSQLETVTLTGDIIRHSTARKGNSYITQAILISNGEHILCLWRHQTKGDDFKLDKRYALIGRIQRKGVRLFMVQPHIKELDSLTPTPVKNSRNRFKALKVSFGVISAIVGFAIFVGLAGPSPSSPPTNSNASSRDNLTQNTYSYSSQSSIPSEDYAPALSNNYQSDKSLYTPNDCDFVTVPYSKKTTTSYLYDAGTETITTYGRNGTEKVCYPNGRDSLPIRTTVTFKVDQVTTIGLYVKPSYTSPSYSPSYSGYTNSAGNYVPSPTYSGGTSIGGYSPSATCRDGTTSYSQSRSGTCSAHGGVSSWY